MVETGFLQRKHHRLRFTELEEAFWGRVILSKCPDSTCRDVVSIRLCLSDLYRHIDPNELIKRLKDVTFQVSDKMTELTTDVLNWLSQASIEPSTEAQPALEYFRTHIESRLKWLRDGDEPSGDLPCIEVFTVSESAELPTFDIKVRPVVLVERLAERVQNDLERSALLLRDFCQKGMVSGSLAPRIDYRKQVETLVKFLDDRQQSTGEREFYIHSNAVPFRWALSTAPGLTLLSIGTTTVQDKILLPLLLEINGLLDIHSIDLDSDPLDHEDVVVRYYVSRPASKNLFGATGSGLEPACRARLSETELCLYERLHSRLANNLVFGGRPKLERSFGSLCSWLVRKAAYCLEEPSFLRIPAQQWLSQHSGDQRIRLENNFFLPAIYERLREEFGSRVVKKPERFAGEIDILFDDIIPIELKVRRDKREPISITELTDCFKAGGQAAAYAAVSRLGIVVVLDLPEGEQVTSNLENCANVIVREIPAGAEFPTCIVAIVMHCHHPQPSSTR